MPGPGGAPFTQAMARQLAQEPWLAFACGRYEGIDERVYEHARGDLGLEVSVVSLGDYVLNGGEVAVLAMVEAIGRLVPGVIGNAESLVEESHEDGLLEYPIYTKPREWNGREVPPILLSGNHAAIAAWRHEQRLARTAARRPDLLHASHGDGRGRDRRGHARRRARAQRALQGVLGAGGAAQRHPRHPGPDREPRRRAGQPRHDADLGRAQGRPPRRRGAHLAARDDWFIGRLCVVPDLRGRGLGRRLLEHAESTAPDGIRTMSLDTGARSADNLRMYKKAGYRVVPGCGRRAGGAVRLTKRRRV